MKLPTRLTPLGILSIVVCPALFFVFSCTSMPMQLTVKNTGDKYPADTIISARTGQAVTFDDLLKDLTAARIVYVGETHTNPAHHAVQTRRIEALAAELAPQVGADPALARRAATLCKADLVSQVVGEFANLQGIMGRIYASVADEAKDVAAVHEEDRKFLSRR